jgi:hypothetical protein
MTRADAEKGTAVVGDGVPEEKPVKRGVVRREQGLEVVHNLPNHERHFLVGEIAICRLGPSLHLSFKPVQQLAYLLKALVHVAQNSTPEFKDLRSRFNS